MKYFNVLWIWRTLRASYWFIPSLMVCGALILSFVTAHIDVRLGGDWMRELSTLFDSRPEGARAVLAAIAGSMITVAGVTFSMTVVSVSFAAAQFGPRLVTNFMRDTGNQVTLGVFIATFAYSLMALRTVRSADVAESADSLAAFVPHVTVLVALLMALACVVVLIYYIHHVPETINIANITAAVGRQLNHAVEKHFMPLPGAADQEAVQRATPPPFDDGLVIRAMQDGYVQFVDLDGIRACAADHRLLLRLASHPGDFVSAGDALLVCDVATRADDDTQSALRCHFQFGRERTPEQNILFLVDELVEILARALSPGQNDPFTAIGCMNWLRSALLRVVERAPAHTLHHDDDGRVCLIAPTVTVERFAAAMFDQTLPYVSTDRNAALAMMDVLAAVGTRCRDTATLALLARHAQDLAAASARHLPTQRDRAQIDACLRTLQAPLDTHYIQMHEGLTKTV